MVDGGSWRKVKIHHKNMADSVVENGGRYGGQKNNKNICININKKFKKNNGLHSNNRKKKQKTGVKNKKGCQIEKGKKQATLIKNGCQTEKRKRP